MPCLSTAQALPRAECAVDLPRAAGRLAIACTGHVNASLKTPSPWPSLTGTARPSCEHAAARKQLARTFTSWQAVSSGSTTISTPRQMLGQRAAPGAPLVRACLAQRRIGLLLFGLALSYCLFEIFQGQVELVGIELFRAPAELHPLHLAKQVAPRIH